MPQPPAKQPKRRLEKQSQIAKGSGNLTWQSEIVLLAVTGISPAILTETVWALAQGNPPVLPDRVVVLTTTVGKEQIERELFTPQPHFNDQCGWDCLREKLQERGHDVKGHLRFDPGSDLHILTRWDESSHRNLFLSDIRTADDNEAVADCILEFVRGIVESPDTRLIASIAGGRKTMGTLLYACMTLVGREEDRLTHVLVNEPFDDARLSPRFYFPEQSSAELTTPDNKTVLAAEAHIDLADVPFVPLRNLFARELGRMPGRFSALVAQCSEGIRKRSGNSVKLVVHRSRPEIEVNDIRIKLSPKEQLLTLFLADRNRKAQPAFAVYKEAENSLNEYREQLRREAPENDFSDWRRSNSIASDLDEQDIRKAVSSLRRTKLRAAGPDAMVLRPFLPEAGRLSIDLPRNQILVVG
jgi:CRISPR-associated protein (TIGR02584 family)